MIGKFAQGLRGFPSPNEPAGTSAYLLIYFPDLEWSQYALGALLNLTQSWNWYEAGDLKPDEAADMFRQIIAQAPLNHLPTCSLPGGGELTRIDPTTGKIQNVGEDGEWQNDPSIPPPQPRPDEPGDQKCLGVANTANALQILYENLSDSWNAGLSTAQAIAEFIGAVGGGLGAVFAPPVAAIIAIGEVLFGVVYEVVSFVGADVWTEDFNAKLLCVLYECATLNDDMTVTYDFQCVIDKLASITNLETSLTQIRLFGQLYYILSWIGVDGLNASTSATAITSATCACEWCYEWDFTAGDGGFTPVVHPSTGLIEGVYVPGTGWRAGNQNDGCNAHGYLQIYIDISMSASANGLLSATADVGLSSGSMTPFIDQDNGTTIINRTSFTNVPPSPTTAAITAVDCNRILVGFLACGQVSGYPLLTRLRLTGRGEMPAFSGGNPC